MSQFSHCQAIQVDLQLRGEYKPLAEIILENAFIPARQLQNLKLFRDQEGKSLIPGYEIVQTIGEGGLALVYLARDTETSETVAFKVFVPNTSDTSGLARFIRGAETAKNLYHPNIVKAYDMGSVYGIYYLAMEHISGLSLAHIISKMGRMEEQKALEILEQIASALSYAWQHGIIHRDVKPENILSDGETFKICDFSIAKARESDVELTAEGSIVGTPQFMSPEQFQPGVHLDYRSDVYSLGVTFYCMLTGHLPFAEDTQGSLSRAHLTQDPIPLKKFQCQVSRPTKALLYKMLAKKPEDRCRREEDLLRDIRRVRARKFPKRFISIRWSMSLLFCAALLAGSFYIGHNHQWNWQQIKALFVNVDDGVDPDPPLQPINQSVHIKEILPTSGQTVESDTLEIKGVIECGRLQEVKVAGKSARIFALGDENWSFQIQISLQVGANSFDIVAIAEAGNQERYKYEIRREVPDTEAPAITLKKPTGIENGGKYEATEAVLNILGYASDNVGVTAIHINQRAIPILATKDKTLFEVNHPLTEGEQQITIAALDEKGNRQQLTFTAYLAPRGWFGEKLPEHIVRSDKRGEYLWKRDQSVMIYIPAGEFWDGKQARSLPAYYIDKFEVSWKNYTQFCEETKREPPKKPSWSKISHPVVNVSANDALEYSDWLGKKLPTVWQWKKAARGGFVIPDWQNRQQPLATIANPMPRRVYPWGDEMPNALSNGEKTYRCNYCANNSFIGQASDGYMYTARGGDFATWNSPYGVSDMAGNVLEMCMQGKAVYKMGGSFYSLAEKCTIDHVEKFNRQRHDSQTGFRLVFVVK